MMPSAVVSRMAPSSSALAWPTARSRRNFGDRGRLRDRGRRSPALRGACRRRSGRARNRRPRKSCRGARRSPMPPHARPMAGCAEIVTGVPVSEVLRGVGDAGLDIERVEAAGLFQRMQAVIADRLEKCRVGIEQPVEPVDQDACGQQIEQRPVAPASPRAGGSGGASHSGVAMAGAWPAARGSPHGAGPSTTASAIPVTSGASGSLSFSSRADNCRASSSKALFSTGVSDGGLTSPGAR